MIKDVPLAVVTTVYNEETHLESSLYSVLDQEYRDFEFIIVNDGSTDNTPSILARIEKDDSRVTVLTLKERSGRAAAANAGIVISDAPIIARHDADDISMPDRFDLQVAALRFNPAIGAVGAGMYVGDSVKQNPPEVRHEIYRQMLVNHPTLMFRREYWEKTGGYDKDLERCSDWDFCCKMVKAGCTICNLPAPLVKYHISMEDPAYYRDVHTVAERWAEEWTNLEQH